MICVEETAKLWEEESARLGQRVSCYDHVAPMQWRHLNVFNSLFSAAKRKGRRYRTVRNLLAILYLIAGKLRESCY